MSKRTWFRAWVALLSAGWLVPMWLGLQTVLNFLRVEAWPLWRGEVPLNSFPFVGFASGCFQLGFLWLGLVVAGWAWAAADALWRPRT